MTPTGSGIAAGAPVPFVDLAPLHDALRDDLHRLLDDVLAGGAFVGGAFVDGFEHAFASYCGAASAIGVANGTDALRLALDAVGVRRGDEVVTVANTFAATVEAIVQLGAVPRFVDVDAATGTLDPARLEAALTARTAAIVPVHLYGQPADMDPILAIARARGLAVVEDACQAHGARYRGRRVGALADASAFSFYPAKNLGCLGDGGAVVTDSEAVDAAVRLLRDHGQRAKYTHERSGWNSRLDALQAGVLQLKLPTLDEANAERRRAAGWYRDRLGAREGIGLQQELPHAESVYHLFVVRVADRDGLRAHLQAQGVATGLHYPVPLHRQSAFADLQPGVALPETERWAAELVSLPMFPGITEAQVDHVCEAIAAWQAGRRA